MSVSVDITIPRLDKAEAAIAAKNVSLDVALENLCTLDGRVQVDYVHDDAPDELRNEIQVIQVENRGSNLITPFNFSFP